jgi:hypothetical protein
MSAARHDSIPDCADRIAANVAHVGIHGFAAGHRQKDTTEHGDPLPAVPRQQRDSVAWITTAERTMAPARMFERA